MSVVVNGNDISLTRGDSLILNISITRNNESYSPSSGDVVRFALNTNTDATDEPLILKYVDTNTMQLTIDPSDTKSLEYKTYYYDIELTTEDGYVDTFIGPAKFKITREVY